MKIVNSDCLEYLKQMPDNSIDAIVTDPPYGLSFMGKKWDYDVPSQEIWEECLRVLKPGGYLLAFAGTRTQHRMAVRIEDAGFEIRDMIAWVYGSGFPKSLNIGKIMNKYIKTGNASWNGTGDSSNGALGYSKLQHQQGYRPADYSNKHQDKSEITEDKAKEWEGWGTALKPALEPITVARKPIEGNVASNCLKWGVGGINIDGCRISHNEETKTANRKQRSAGWNPDNCGFDSTNNTVASANPTGRFPANLIHDGSDEVVGLFPQTKSSGGQFKSTDYEERETSTNFTRGDFVGRNDSGSAARFFMTCKYTPNDAIMKLCEDNIYANNAENSLPITNLIEQVVNIYSVLKSVPPNLDLLNQSLNALYAEKKPKNTVIDFVAKLVAISEVPEDLVSQEELIATQDFISNLIKCSQNQNCVDVEKWENINIIQIIINLLKLSGYVLLATDENTNSERKEVVGENGEPKRFAYIPKASKSERNRGCEDMEEKTSPNNLCSGSVQKSGEGTRLDGKPLAKNTNNHPTVKPIALMEYLVKLVSKEGHTVLDPFMGSGSTGIACKKLGREFIGIERESDYCKIAEARIGAVQSVQEELI